MVAASRGRSTLTLERMNRVVLVVLPLVSAAVFPAVVVWVYLICLGAPLHQATWIELLALVVSAGHVLILGIPLVLLLSWRNCLRWWSITIAGAMAGAVPVGILIWPLRNAGSHSGSVEDGVVTMIDGVPTFAGWLDFGEAVLSCAGLGAVGAVAFWITRRHLMRSNYRWSGP